MALNFKQLDTITESDLELSSWLLSSRISPESSFPIRADGNSGCNGRQHRHVSGAACGIRVRFVNGQSMDPHYVEFHRD